MNINFSLKELPHLNYILYLFWINTSLAIFIMKERIYYTYFQNVHQDLVPNVHSYI